MTLTAGMLLEAEGQHDAAYAVFREVAERTNDPNAWSLTAANAERRGHWQDAVDALTALLALDMCHVDAWRRLGDAYVGADALRSASFCYEKALNINPEHPDALVHNGNAKWNQGLVESAAHWYALALKTTAKPCAEYNLARVHEIRGDWTTARMLRESRWDCPAYAERYGRKGLTGVPRWHGHTAIPSLLVWCEEGVGDFLQGMRYLPVIAPRVERLIVEVPPSLLRLCRLSFPQYEFTERGQPQPIVSAHLPSASLAYVANGVECGVPYLQKPGGVQPNTNLVGLCWAGSPKYPRDRERSMPCRQLLNVLPDGAHWASLQVGPRADDWRTTGHRPPTAMLSLTADYLATASLITACSAIVTVDTSVAHLAGALGVRTVVLLPSFPDPRWLMGVGTTSLYSSMTLVRQQKEGDWSTAVNEAKAILEAQC